MKALDVNRDEHDIVIDELIWRPSVYGIVINQDSILLSPQHGKGYELPGGGVNMDESIEQALVREVKEETGIDVVAGRMVDVKDNFFVWKPDNPNKRQAMHSILMFYMCTKVGGDLTTDGFDEDEHEYAELAEWVPLSKLGRIPVTASFDWRSIVECVLAENRQNMR